ncbi:MAG: hypothetical protein A2081_03080 [Elusimicrobia bacterium GWC2_61_19]|nr:MAG: hypothetical protein A2081_03080 [Elusimicrobia bacterium GWC2_61_19]
MTNPKKTLLIVDNDQDWLALLGKMLSSEGYAVLTAHNCAAALLQAEQGRPDCVIADLHLGHEDGLTLCRSIKRSPQLKHIPFILLSGAEPEETGCDSKDYAFVCKSDGTARLLRAVRKALD